MRKAIGRILAWIGGLALGLVVLTVLSVVLLSGEEPVPDRVILEIDLEQGVAEYVPDDPFAKLLADEVHTLRDVVGALDAAASDDRVVGLLARGGGAPMGFAPGTAPLCRRGRVRRSSAPSSDCVWCSRRSPYWTPRRHGW